MSFPFLKTGEGNSYTSLNSPTCHYQSVYVDFDFLLQTLSVVSSEFYCYHQPSSFGCPCPVSICEDAPGTCFPLTQKEALTMVTSYSSKSRHT